MAGVRLPRGVPLAVGGDPTMAMADARRHGAAPLGVGRYPVIVHTGMHVGMETRARAPPGLPPPLQGGGVVAFVDAGEGLRGRPPPALPPPAGGLALMTGVGQPGSAPQSLPPPGHGGETSGMASGEPRARAPLGRPPTTRGGGGIREPPRSRKRSGTGRPYRGCRGGRRGKRRTGSQSGTAGGARVASRTYPEAWRCAGRLGGCASSARPDSGGRLEE